MALFDPVRFIAQHGVVLASARGAVPNIAEAIAGAPIRGSWWGHPKSQEIFDALSALDGSPDVLCFKLVDSKVTFVHRRLWPALVRLAGELGDQRLGVVKQEHTETGVHRSRMVPFPEWVSADVFDAARALTESEARAQLGPWAAPSRSS